MVINECLVFSWVLLVGKAVVSNLHGTIIIMNLAQNVLYVLSKCVCVCVCGWVCVCVCGRLLFLPRSWNLDVRGSSAEPFAALQERAYGIHLRRGEDFKASEQI